MPNPLSPILAPLGLDPSQGYDTAAAGARQAQDQANALSQQQWGRQMQGLGQAQGYTDQLQSLYNSMYSPGGGQMAAGGRGPQAPGIMQGAMQSLQPPPPAHGAGPAAGGGNGKILGAPAQDWGDFVPGLGQASRLATFAQHPSWSSGARAAASFVPGANLAYDEGKALFNKIF